MCHTSLLPMEKNFITQWIHLYGNVCQVTQLQQTFVNNIKYITQKETLMIYCLRPHGKGDKVE